MQADTDDDPIIEDDVPSKHLAPAPPEAPPWRILIVDDDVDVHVVTKFALSNTHFQGRRLSFLHAYSGKEALSVLRDTQDVALVLLDVIMETEDAGLRVARQIRDDLHNDLVRIVLRTGQPGQSLEHSIIIDYDINDFWCKADLTTRKLFTTVISSLRAYAALAQAKAQRDRLVAELDKARQAREALGRQALLLTLDARGVICDASEMLCTIAGKRPEDLLGHDLHALHAGAFPEATTREVLAALAIHGAWTGELPLVAADGKTHELRCTVAAISDAGGAPWQYEAVATLPAPLPPLPAPSPLLFPP